MKEHLLARDVALYTDLYQLTMAQGYFLEGKAEQTACFDYFFRKNPFGGGYVVFAGLQELLQLLESFRFQDDALHYLETQGFDPSFLEHLRELELTLEIKAPREGEVVFPYLPSMRVRGPLLQAQLIETMLLNTINFSSLVATRASRMRNVAGDRRLIDFGLRRAQGLGGLAASRAAIIGGFDATSNVLAGQINDIEIAGTQAHSWIQSFPDELTAFRAYARNFPDRCILLVDTYDTLKSGIPNAITVARELREKGHELVGVRLDSGDLAYLAKRSREQFDEAGFPDVKIAASNQLDEHVIKSLLQDQNAPIDVFGVGTQLVTAYDDPALGGVYKLSEIDGEPRLKISESYEKVNFPGAKKVVRLIGDDGKFYGDAVALEDEDHVEHMYHPYDPFKDTPVDTFQQEPLQQTVMHDGEVVAELHSVHEAREYAKKRLACLPIEHLRFENPHIYKVGLSRRLHELRRKTLETAKTVHHTE